jgi:hypothetical protein
LFGFYTFNVAGTRWISRGGAGGETLFVRGGITLSVRPASGAPGRPKRQ